MVAGGAMVTADIDAILTQLGARGGHLTVVLYRKRIQRYKNMLKNWKYKVNSND